MSQAKEKLIKRKRHQKLLALVEQISTIRREKNLTQKEVGDGIGMDKGQMSRLMSAEKNVTIETVVRIEDFLGHEVLVTPDDRDESLVKDPERLWTIFEVALNTESGSYLIQMATQNARIKTQSILSNHFSFDNGIYLGKPINHKEDAQVKKSDELSERLNEKETVKINV